MKDNSDLMIDLAYAALLFGSDELADRVHELEGRMDELMYRIRTIAALSARNPRQAEQITGILQVASAAEEISDATGDMVDLLRRDIEIHPVVREAIVKADEKLAEIEIAKGSVLAGKKFIELRLPASIGVWILAVKRGTKWIASPDKEFKLLAGDMLVARGPRDGVGILSRMAGKPKEVPPIRKHFLPVGKVLGEMRDLSSVMVDMAYSSLLLRSRLIAEELRELEERFDRLNYKIWLATLKAARRERDLKRLNSALQVARCMERISDAADWMADIVLRGVRLHPVFEHAIAESDEMMDRVKVLQGSSLVDRTLGELNLWTTAGAYVLMVKRGERYIFDPSPRVRLRVGDSLIVRSTKFAIKKLKRMGAS